MAPDPHPQPRRRHPWSDRVLLLHGHGAPTTHHGRPGAPSHGAPRTGGKTNAPPGLLLPGSPLLHGRRKVIEDGSLASNRSVVTESVSKSCSSAEVKDEDVAIAVVIDAAELKWEEQSFRRGQAPGRFTSGRHNGHGSSEREAPPPGYVCRSYGVPGHFIQHCPQENQTPPPGYTCYRCRVPGHFIQHCPTIGGSRAVYIYCDTLNIRTMWTKLACGCTKAKVPLIKG
ncbi:unnamed protein product [Triticum turgidum subsp. durum]|uniref:CCHC-type domain-containing protein n=2 Tax=Triticum TaxID=4564 RepID=A0A9R1A0G9_TRITD|nr:unnamed protein product [Triticum turgidum subsp. durum]